MHVLIVRHHDIDEAGFIAAAFAARGARLSVHLVPRDGPLPPLDGTDHIVVLGAAWSVYDEARIGHWVSAELDWLRQADARGVPVLGICFGAQALAAAHGGSVRAAARQEIGWVTVETLAPGIIEPGPWLQFHGDECVLPPGARLLARNDLCAQAFALRANLAVQFHPEADGAQLKRWLDNGGDAIAAERAGQEPARFLARTITEEPAAAVRADRLVAAALRLAAAPGGLRAGAITARPGRAA